MKREREEDAHPLAGRSMLVTRPEEGASRMSETLERLGAHVWVAPLIEIGEPEDWAPLDTAIRGLASYHSIVFTSANGPKYLARRFGALGVAPGAIPPAVSLFAIGPATAAAVEAHLGRTPDGVAEKHTAEGVVALLKGAEVAGRRVLLPRAQQGRNLVPEELEKMGALVDDVAVYRTTAAGADALRGVWGALEGGKIDMLTFTSSSACEGFVRAAGVERAREWLARSRVASIGPATSATARRWGIAVDVEAAESTIPGLARAIVSFYRVAAGNPQKRGSETT